MGALDFVTQKTEKFFGVVFLSLILFQVALWLLKNFGVIEKSVNFIGPVFWMVIIGIVVIAAASIVFGKFSFDKKNLFMLIITLGIVVALYFYVPQLLPSDFEASFVNSFSFLKP